MPDLEGPHDILLGTPVPPLDKLKIMSSDDFETMVLEWAFDYLGSKYAKVRKIGGAGDKGRDIIAYHGETLESFDIYQCKHYDSPLSPSQYWTEFGKLCFYTFNGDYAIPNRYFIVASQGIGGVMTQLLENPKQINQQLIANWDKCCKVKITTKSAIEMTDALKTHIESFDFSIVEEIAPHELLSQYEQTKWFKYRFGGGLKRRPKVTAPPVTMDASEKALPYVTELLNVYSEHARTDYVDAESIKANPPLHEHFQRQRLDFHSAQALKRFTRDELVGEPYEQAKDEVFRSVVDVAEQNFSSGYDRVNATLREARNLPLEVPDLGQILPSDKSGMCHELVNDTKLTWVRK